MLPCHYPQVGLRVGSAFAIEEQDAGPPVYAQRPARLSRFLGPQKLEQATETGRPGLAGHDARLCREAHGLAGGLIVHGDEEVDASEYHRPGDQ